MGSELALKNETKSGSSKWQVLRAPVAVVLSSRALAFGNVCRLRAVWLLTSFRTSDEEALPVDSLPCAALGHLLLGHL